MEAPEFVHRQITDLGLSAYGKLHYNLSPSALYEQALCRGEASLAEHGPLVARTDPHTGRSPRDRFIVEEATTADRVGWGKVNCPIDPDVFDRLLSRMAAYAEGRELFVQDVFAGADPKYRMPVRIISEKAWHSLFAHNMFIRRHPAAAPRFKPAFTVLDLCDFKADPEIDGTRSDVFIIINLKRRLVLIGGTRYAGEIKKSIFTILNFVFPEQDVFPMHCSANMGEGGETAVFFGLSGTGKTTLSASQDRVLIGDDEHGWSTEGVFNFEGGSYAKMIHLSPEGEPEIYATTQRFGTVLENVVLDPETREPDFEDASLTENTRGSYPIHFIPHASRAGRGGHPEHVIFLTADAFGVMPPISRLTPEQAMYHFLSGYTAKVAGTERGVSEPQATFSACFGEPFMVRPPSVYAAMLGDKIRKHGSRCWLINTGWTGGPYGTGRRIDLAHTRAMVRAILSGIVDEVEVTIDPVFGLAIPAKVPHVPTTLLDPRATWQDPEAYDRLAAELADMLAHNIERYTEGVSEAVLAAGPHRVAV